jgi:cardiolipin synthase
LDPYLVLDIILGGLALVFALFSAGHALLNKEDPRAALGWIMVSFALPFIGPCLYWILGVNRIRTRARSWQTHGQGFPHVSAHLAKPLTEPLPFRSKNFTTLLDLSDRITRRPLVSGNQIQPLHNGEMAYPAMLEAIQFARKRVWLSTYIFDNDQIGQQFAEALSEAAEWGVDVRVMIDALGERYSFPPIRWRLKRGKVRVVRFLPPSLLGKGVNFNLRNHRKLLVVDDHIGFVGGMNIGARHLAEDAENPRRVIDLHFEVSGPVLVQMAEAFLEDWTFVTEEPPEGLDEKLPEETGDALCRGISAGPNEDFEKLQWLIIGAISCAQRSVHIMTPYFIPSRPLVAMLKATALRGVAVEIVLPSRNNLPYVAWASQAYQRELLQYGVRIFYQPPPFVHSKLLLIDDQYALVGSANLDPRSLRLNFEFNLEVYDKKLARSLSGHFEEKRNNAKEVTLDDVEERSLPRRLRDALFKLFSPYL